MMGLVRGLDSGAIPLARPSDIAASAFGGEYETMGNVKDLIFGADLSNLENIWSKMLTRSERTDERREQARAFAEELAPRGKRLKP